MNERFSKTPEPPYYAVIFTNQLSQDDCAWAAGVLWCWEYAW